jgi:hypothetical protein
MAPTSLPGIFCLEGDWNADLRSRQSVEPVLQLLAECDAAQYIHRDVATKHELDHYLDRWFGRGLSAYRVGYLGFHGSPRTLHLSKKETLDLDELADAIDGRGSGKTLYFGACGTLGLKDEVLMDFCRRTGVRGVVGYTKSVDYIESLSFELVLLWDLLHRANLKSTYERLRREHPVLTRRLGLRMAHGLWASDRSITK